MSDSQRVVVVTGGSRGIGRTVALKFAEESARIVLVHYDPDESASDETVKMLRKTGVEPVSYKTDVSSTEDVKVLIKEIIGSFGRIDVLINNAGITRDTLLMRMSERDWDMVISVNLKSVYNCTQAVLRQMIKQKYGRIVNISSIAGMIGNPGQANYSASKAGIIGFTKSVAREVGSRNVTINAVAPGFIETEMTADLPESVKESYLNNIPLGRAGTPHDVSEAVYWLCSEGASYLTGQTINVNGGMFM